ncbi:MAG: hypothetical protein KAJ01_07085 [Candidatus Hydrogenedentes bacterium]|nr:hypothetical protein [Candidatus Hydrogenedentota bacterium]
MEIEIFTGGDLLVACIFGILAGLLISLLTLKICVRQAKRQERELTDEQFERYLNTVVPVTTMNVVSKNPEHMIN